MPSLYMSLNMAKHNMPSLVSCSGTPVRSLTVEEADAALFQTRSLDNANWSLRPKDDDPPSSMVTIPPLSVPN